jgi:hypothetical protein
LGLYDAYETSAEVEKDGVWLEVTNEARAKIARAGGKNGDYLKAIAAAARKSRLSTLSETQAAEVLADVYSKTVVKGWQTLIDGHWRDQIETRNGLVNSTPEAVKAVLIDLPDLLTAIKDEAERLENFRAERKEDAAGN